MALSIVRKSWCLLYYSCPVDWTIEPKRYVIKNIIPIRLTLSAIAKGFAVDEIAGYLDMKWIEFYLIEVGCEFDLCVNKVGLYGMIKLLSVNITNGDRVKIYRSITAKE